MIKYLEDQLAKEGLDALVPAYGNILTVLYNHEGQLMMKEIGEIIGKDKSTISLLVKKLVNLGYIKREKSKEDGRVTYIVLTEKSYAIKDQFDKISNALFETAYDGFSEDEKETFLALLKKMNNNFDQ
jgi:DNA-binding MarR family transcriptional regulator